MELKLAEVILLAMWVLAGTFVVVGELTNNPKLQCSSLFAVENRWGKFSIGVILLAFVIMRAYQWYSSPNPTFSWSL